MITTKHNRDPEYYKNEKIINDVKKVFNEIDKKYNTKFHKYFYILDKIYINKRFDTVAGYCTCKQPLHIEVSEKLVKYFSEDVIKNTIAHEFIHAYLFLEKHRISHDREFNKLMDLFAVETGYQKRKSYRFIPLEDIEESYKKHNLYNAYCPHCGTKFVVSKIKYNRILSGRKVYYCGDCYEKTGKKYYLKPLK